MSIPARSINNPLALIATLAAMTEASALASLPLLDYRNQGVFVWFLVGFPPFLTLLFFVTLNFNRKALSEDGPRPEVGIPLPERPELPEIALPTVPQPDRTPAPRVEALPGTAARLHILDVPRDADWQQLRPRVCAWADEALAQPQGAAQASVMLVLCSRP